MDANLGLITDGYDCPGISNEYDVSEDVFSTHDNCQHERQDKQV